MSGTVFIGDFDEGMIKRTGAVLTGVNIEGPQNTVVVRQEYAVVMAGVAGPTRFSGRVPVFFVAGSMPFQPKYFPCIVVRRTQLDPAFENGSQASGIEYRKAADGASTVTATLPAGTVLTKRQLPLVTSNDVNGIVLTGPDSWEVKPPATPFNIGYDIMLRTRGAGANREANLMFKQMLKICTPRGFAIDVVDSEGDTRGYDALLEGLAQTSDVLDLTARDVGWTLSVLVHGELDHFDPVDLPAVSNTAVVGVTRK